jgi:hypothetical protein
MLGGSIPGRDWEFHPSPPLGPHRLWCPSSLLSNDYQGLFPWGEKRPWREADHSPPSSAEVRNAWNYTSTSQYAFIAWCSVKAQGQLYLYLYMNCFRNRGNSVSRVIRLRDGRQRFNCGQEKGAFLFATAVSRPARGSTEPPIL